MLLKTFQDIWVDPVWSKVIASFIILFLTQAGVFIIGKVKKISFGAVYRLGFSKIKNSIQSKKKTQPSENRESKRTKETVITDHPTVFFHHRFIDAFSGMVPGFEWFSDKKDILRRLKILLAHPTKFTSSKGYGVTSDPIWWFRGTGALPIERFLRLNKEKVLLNIDELIIEKIAAYRGRGYYEDFVYVLCSADTPTGLYNHDETYLRQAILEDSEYFEEYARYGRRLITRQEHDDGSAIIRGKPRKLRTSELRSRSLIPYNFIISSKFSPYNCMGFSRDSRSYFGSLLRKEISFEEFILWINKFPRNENDN
jgi:hypothetical protein